MLPTKPPTPTDLYQKKPPGPPKTQQRKSSSGEKSPSSSANIESTIAGPKHTPTPGPTGRDFRIHPAVWALLGGMVAVLGLVIAFALISGGKQKVSNADDRESSAGKPQTLEDSKPKSDKPSTTKVILSVEELFARASPGVAILTVKNDSGESIGSGSAFFLRDELVHDTDNDIDWGEWWRKSADFITKKEGRPTQYVFVLTNYHVIKAALDLDISLTDASSSSVVKVDAEVGEVVSEDEEMDLALLSLHVHSGRPLTRLRLADSTPQVGSKVYAIGSPRGLANSLSEGIISGFREMKPGISWLQTTAPISPGSSGGPLLGSGGEVVGITTAILRDGQNLNFAIPASSVRRFLSAPYRHRELWQGRSYRGQETHELQRLEVICCGKDVAADDLRRSLLKARRQINEKNYQDAIKILSDAMPSIPVEYRYLGHFLLGKAHFWLAIKHVGKGRRFDESVKNFQNNDHAEAALESLKEAARLNTKFAPTYALLAEYHYEAAEWAEGLVAADSLVKLMPKCAEAYYKRGEFFSMLNRPKSALEEYQVSLKLNPRDAYVHVLTGDAWFDLHEYEKSIDSYVSALSMKYRGPGYCHFKIGSAYQEIGKYEQAIPAFEKARSLGCLPEVCDKSISICRERIK